MNLTNTTNCQIRYVYYWQAITWNMIHASTVSWQCYIKEHNATNKIWNVYMRGWYMYRMKKEGDPIRYEFVEMQLTLEERQEVFQFLLLLLLFFLFFFLFFFLSNITTYIFEMSTWQVIHVCNKKKEGDLIRYEFIEMQLTLEERQEVFHFFFVVFSLLTLPHADWKCLNEMVVHLQRRGQKILGKDYWKPTILLFTGFDEMMMTERKGKRLYCTFLQASTLSS